jgi:hypothetical protein
MTHRRTLTVSLSPAFAEAASRRQAAGEREAVKKLGMCRHPGENRGPGFPMKIGTHCIKWLPAFAGTGLDSGFRRNDEKKNKIDFFTPSGWGEGMVSFVP